MGLSGDERELLTYENPWTFQGEEVNSFDDKYVSFVYCITNIQTLRRYVGKKLLTSTRRQRPRAGFKRRKRITKESKWRDYYGSNKELQADIDKIGKKFFRREILRFCETKGEASYYEAKIQFDLDVLRSPEYYNSWICVKVHRTHLHS